MLRRDSDQLLLLEGQDDLLLLDWVTSYLFGAVEVQKGIQQVGQRYF